MEAGNCYAYTYANAGKTARGTYTTGTEVNEMAYAIELTREQKQEVFTLARELGVSPTALYRELGTAAPVRAARVTVREEVEADNARQVRTTGRTVSMAVTAACKRELTAARETREHGLARTILRALPGRGVMLVSRAGKRAGNGVDVYAVTDRRGTMEYAGRIITSAKRARVYAWDVPGKRPEVLTESALLDVLADILPARVDSVPARMRDGLRFKRYREVSDRTGEAAAKAAAAAQAARKAAAAAALEATGERAGSMHGVKAEEAHLRESNRLRVQRFRAKQRAAREATATGTAAIAPVKEALPAVPSVDKDSREAAEREAATLRAEREAWKAREAAKAAPALVAKAAPVSVSVPALVAEAEAEREADAKLRAKRRKIAAAGEAESEADAKWIADMRAKHPEVFPAEAEFPETLF